MYLLLESTNWIHFYNEAGHVSTHGNVYSLNPCLTDGEWLCPPPGTISNKTSMQLQKKNNNNTTTHFHNRAVDFSMIQERSYGLLYLLISLMVLPGITHAAVARQQNVLTSCHLTKVNVIKCVIAEDKVRVQEESRRCSVSFLFPQVSGHCCSVYQSLT